MPELPYYAQPGFSYKTQAAAPWYTSSPNMGGGSWSSAAYKPGISLMNNKAGFKAGASIFDFLKGLKDSPLWQQLQQSGFNPEQMLASNPAYQKLLAMGNQSFGDYWNQIGGKIDEGFASPLAHYGSVLKSKNPSNIPIASTELLAAQGMAPLEAGARDLRQQLMAAGGAGGNRSGVGALATMLPGQLLASEGARVRTQASLGNIDEARQRESMNAQLKMEAAGGQAGIAGQKGQLLAGGLQGFTAAQMSSFQAALQALLSVLNLKAGMMPQLQLGGTPGDPTFNLNMPLAA